MPADPAAVRDLPALRDWVNARPLAIANRFTCESIEEGCAVFSFDPLRQWRNPNGSMPGSSLAALADHSCGFAATSVTTQDDYVSTVDLGLHFMRPAFTAPAVSTTTVLRRGQRLLFLSTEIRDGDGELVAAGIGSFAVHAGMGGQFPIGRDIDEE